MTLRLVAAGACGGLAALLAGQPIGKVLGPEIGTVLAWVIFLLLGSLVFVRCDTSALVRLVPEYTGRRSRVHRHSPDRNHAEIVAGKIRPGIWIAQSRKRKGELQKADAKARHRQEQRAAVTDEKVVVFEEASASLLPPIEFRQVLTVAADGDGGKARIGFVGGEVESYQLGEMFYHGRWSLRSKPRTDSEEQAFTSLMMVMKQHRLLPETDLLQQLISDGNGAAESWLALRAALHTGLISRGGLGLRLPWELLQVLVWPSAAGSGSQHQIELTQTGREWLEATQPSVLPWMGQVVHAHGQNVHLDFNSDVGQQVLIAMKELLVLLAQQNQTASANHQELMSVLRDLHDGRDVPQDKAKRAFDRAGDIGVGAFGSLAGGLLLRIIVDAHKFF